MTKEISHSMGNWEFSFKEAGLSPSTFIDELAQKLKLFRPPNIIFGSNLCLITQKQFSFSFKFNAEQALKFINYEHRKNSICKQEEIGKPNSISYMPQKLFIKHADKWKNLQAPKDIEISQIQQSSDCFFITPFKGHLEPHSNQTEIKIQKIKETVIPIEKLGPTNEILFYFQGSLYEDELDDNGLIQYQYKFRAMKNSWFGLIRCYVRVDEVIVMILDTRIYWEEGWSKIARQFMVKRCEWSKLKTEKNFQFKNGWTMDPHQSHQIYNFLDQQFVQNQYIHFGLKKQ